MSAPTVGSLFSGIGGLDLGLERAGWCVEWQAENNPYCSQVLAQHWAHIPNLGDVTQVDWSTVERVDLICGGFPCQPFSSAGARRGLDDERWLWPNMADAVRNLRPSYVLVENVTGFVARGGGLGAVLGDLAALGYDAEWQCVPAAAVGAPHRRDRIFVVAYPYGRVEPVLPVDGQMGRSSETVGHTDSTPPYARPSASRPRRAVGESAWWSAEPDVARVVDGLPGWMDRRQALGNAVVPQVAEWIGSQLLHAISAQNQEAQG